MFISFIIIIIIIISITNYQASTTNYISIINYARYHHQKLSIIDCQLSASSMNQSSINHQPQVMMRNIPNRYTCDLDKFMISPEKRSVFLMVVRVGNPTLIWSCSMFNFMVDWCKHLPAGDVFFCYSNFGIGNRYKAVITFPILS